MSTTVKRIEGVVLILSEDRSGASFVFEERVAEFEALNLDGEHVYLVDVEGDRHLIDGIPYDQAEMIATLGALVVKQPDEHGVEREKIITRIDRPEHLQGAAFAP